MQPERHPHEPSVSTRPPATPEPLVTSLSVLVQTQRLFTQPDPPIKPPTHVVVGVSGGADSVCLLHALHGLASAWGLTLHVAHLDHGLRAASPVEASFVAKLAHALGLPFHTQKLLPGVLHNQPGGLENAARQARYRFLAAVACQVAPPGHVPMIAVAHHADDQAETVLLHLARGSGLHGLGGMKALSLLDPAFLPAERQADAPAVRLVRPLLNTPQGAILDYLAHHQLRWMEDESNQATIHTRNFLRTQVLPLLRQINPNLTETIGRTAQIVAAEAERIDELDRAQFERLLLTQQPGRIVLDVEPLLTLHGAAQRNIVRMALQQLAAQTGAAPQIAMQHVDLLLGALHKSLHASGPHPLTQALAWTVSARSGDTPAQLSLHDENVAPFGPDSPQLDAAWRANTGRQFLALDMTIQMGDWQLMAQNISRTELPSKWRHVSPWTAYLDAELAGQPQVTTPQPGMRFAPLGLQGRHKNLGDFFTDRKVHPSLRRGWPIVVDAESGAILWVCGHQVAYAPRITNRTQQVLQLAWCKAGE